MHFKVRVGIGLLSQTRLTLIKLYAVPGLQTASVRTPSSFLVASEQVATKVSPTMTLEGSDTVYMM